MVKYMTNADAQAFAGLLYSVKTTGAVVEVDGVRIEKCDTNGRTERTTQGQEIQIDFKAEIERLKSLLTDAENNVARVMRRVRGAESAAREAESRKNLLIQERDRDREHIRRLQETNDELRAQLEEAKKRLELPTHQQFARAIDSGIPAQHRLPGLRATDPASAARRVQELLKEIGF